MKSADWLSFFPFSTASPINDAAKLPRPCNPRDPPPVFLRTPRGDPFRRWRKARSATGARVVRYVGTRLNSRVVPAWLQATRNSVHHRTNPW
jgi:hypothetical protein